MASSKKTSTKKKHAPVTPQTDPGREDTWIPVEHPVFDHLLKELRATAYDAGVAGVRKYDAGDLQGPLEQIALGLTKRFTKDAQALFSKVLVRAATLAQTRESIEKAGRPQRVRRNGGTS